MKLLLVIFGTIYFHSVVVAQIVLSGKVTTDDRPPVMIKHTRITAAGIGNTTDGQGEFRIRLEGDLHEGDRIIIKVIKHNWIVNSPVDGNWNLPSIRLQEIQPLTVVIVPRGSIKLWSAARIKAQIAKLVAETARAKKELGSLKASLPSQDVIDYAHYFKQWGDELGFNPSQVKEAFERWVKSVEDSTDDREKGLRDFYELTGRGTTRTTDTGRDSVSVGAGFGDLRLVCAGAISAKHKTASRIEMSENDFMMLLSQRRFRSTRRLVRFRP